MRTFEKNTTNVGGSTGLIIPDWICKADRISKGQKVRVIIEAVEENPLIQILTGNQTEAEA